MVDPTRGSSTGSIGARLARSESEVLQIAVVDRIASLGVTPDSERTSTSLAIVLLGGLPIAACAIEALAGLRVGWFVWSTALVYGLLIAFMIYGARRSWAEVIRLGADIDAILDGEDRQIVLKWLDRALGQIPQLVTLICGGAFSAWVGFKLTGPIGHRYLGDAASAYIFTIGWTGGIGAITVYWLWGSPATLYPLARTEHPKLDWIAPLQTPAVQRASRLMIDSSRLAAIGLFLFTIPISVTLAVASSGWSVWALSISPFVFSLVTVLGCSILPQVALEDLVRRGKSHTLATIRPKLPSRADVFEQPTSEAVLAAMFYERLAHSPVSVVDWRRLVEYLLLLLSAIVPIAIALLSR